MAKGARPSPGYETPNARPRASADRARRERARTVHEGNEVLVQAPADEPEPSAAFPIPATVARIRGLDLWLEVDWAAVDDAGTVEAALVHGDGSPGTGKTRTLVEIVRRAALAGDHRQLPPLAPPRSPGSSYGLSLFEHLYADGGVYEGVGLQLMTQYRIHRDVAYFPTGRSTTTSRTPDGWSTWIRRSSRSRNSTGDAIRPGTTATRGSRDRRTRPLDPPHSRPPGPQATT